MKNKQCTEESGISHSLGISIIMSDLIEDNWVLIDASATNTTCFP